MEEQQFENMLEYESSEYGVPDNADRRFKCGGLDDDIKNKSQCVFPKLKLDALFSGLADSARVSYQNSWLAWGRFCFVRGISIWLAPGGPGRDEPLLEFLIWTSKVLGEVARFENSVFIHAAYALGKRKCGFHLTSAPV